MQQGYWPFVQASYRRLKASYVEDCIREATAKRISQWQNRVCMRSSGNRAKWFRREREKTAGLVRP
jgi:hypothetical protein